MLIYNYSDDNFLNNSFAFITTLAERARLNWIPFAVLIVLLAAFFFAYRSKPKSLDKLLRAILGYFGHK